MSARAIKRRMTDLVGLRQKMWLEALMDWPKSLTTSSDAVTNGHETACDVDHGAALRIQGDGRCLGDILTA